MLAHIDSRALLRVARRAAAPLVLALAAACSGGEGEAATARDGAKPLDSLAARNAAAVNAAGGEVAAKADSGVPAAGGPVTPASAAGGPTRAGDTTAASVGGAADTANVTARVMPGRPKRDSIALVRTIKYGMRKGWPVKMITPAPGSLLPAKRIIAYYGNPLSKKMGVLGEYPVDEMLSRLDREVANWNRADPSTPAIPALHMVATVAQGAPGRDGKYRLKMDSAKIEEVYGWAKRRPNGIFFVDIQTGWSTLQAELPWVERFLKRPDVHLGIDPEFNMHRSREGVIPGKKIGTYDAEDINHAVRFLSNLVRTHKLPPKVLVIHRFTRNMVTNADKIITTDPNVQIVIDMDGWGPPWLKYDSYRDYVVHEPVQYTGFKLFYHNDTKKGDKLLTPQELLQLRPKLAYIQYQ